MITCSGCNKKRPGWMFGRPQQGWNTVTGRNYACRVCRLFSDTLYTAHKGPMGRKLEPYKVGWWYRIKEFFR